MNELAKNAKSFWSILLKSVVTLGIYWWVYLFKTIYKIKGTFAFNDKEIKPNEVRNFLIAYLVVTVVSGLINIGLELQSTPFIPVIPLILRYYFIADVFYLGFTVAFWDTFLCMLEICYKKRRVVIINRRPFWVLVSLMTASYSLRYYDVIIGIEGSAFILLGGVIFLFLMYYIVKKTNRVWTSSELSTSDAVEYVDSEITLYRRKRPLIITLISWIFIIWGAESFLLIFYRFGIFYRFSTADLAVLVLFAADIVLVLCEIGMLKGANWSRLLYLWADPALCSLILFYYFVYKGFGFFDLFTRISLDHIRIPLTRFFSSGTGLTFDVSFTKYPWLSVFYIISLIILLRSDVLRFFKGSRSAPLGSQEFKKDKNVDELETKLIECKPYYATSKA
jgi:hypothetical protein